MILVTLGIGLFLVLKLMWSAFSALDPQMGAALVTGFFTITVSITAVALGRYLEKVKEAEAAYREKRLKVYEDFVDRFYALTKDSPDADKRQAEFIAFLRDFNKKILLWAGSKAVHCYVDMMRRLAQDATAAPSVFSLEDFFKAMRNDLGLDNTQITRGDLLALVLRPDDISRFIAASKADPNVRLGDL